jgi:hypothetical protein
MWVVQSERMGHVLRHLPVVMAQNRKRLDELMLGGFRCNSKKVIIATILQRKTLRSKHAFASINHVHCFATRA